MEELFDVFSIYQVYAQGDEMNMMCTNSSKDEVKKSLNSFRTI